MSHDTLALHNYVVQNNITMLEAMVAMTDNQRGTVVVVNDQYHLEGVVSDGDIRRALVSGRTLTSPIGDVVNLNPTVAKGEEEATELFAKDSSINIVPIIDMHNVVINVVVRNPDIRK